MGISEGLQGAGSVGDVGVPGPPASDEVTLVAGTMAFAAALYRERLAGAPAALFFSPSSIETALAMTAAGARGETATELTTALRLVLPPDRLHRAFGRLIEATRVASGLELSTTNALWAQEGYAFRPEYLALVRDTYCATLEQVDFRGATEVARKRINAWVDAQTAGRIPDLVPPDVLDPLTRIVLVNAVYFKGAWSSPFERRATRDEPFNRIDGTSVTAPLMCQTASYRLVEDRGVQAIELPYGHGALAMVVVLPRPRAGLTALEKALDGTRLERRIAQIDETEPSRVEVHLPRFRVEAGFHLNDVLRRLGAGRAFDSRADFSGMTDDSRGLCIGTVLHRAFVEVNEKGTEAAAATAGEMAKCSPSAPPPIFRADHPFLFLIRDRRTRQVLFIGRLLDPTR